MICRQGRTVGRPVLAPMQEDRRAPLTAGAFPKPGGAGHPSGPLVALAVAWLELLASVCGDAAHGEGRCELLLMVDRARVTAGTGVGVPVPG